ncbi:MAG: hypothetical protein ABR509_02255 [Candidatus Limnocylindria bacterium]
MSRGRPRHQASRRKSYSARQREVRERDARAAREHRSSDGGAIVPVEVDDSGDSELSSWPLTLPDQAPAA